MRRVVSIIGLLCVIGITAQLAGCTININLLPPPGPLEEEVVSGTGKAKVLVLEVSGLISSHDTEGLLQRPNLVAHIKEVLTIAGEDPEIKAVVVRINSPGGTVTASDVIHHELRAFKKKRKIPVVSSIMDIGTSGGYYVASATDQIVAHPSSVTGSVGVIMLRVNASGLLEKIGLEATAVASGPKKDMGSPFRPMTAEERAIFQGVIDGFYEQFLGVVETGRSNLSAEQVRNLADGRIYSGTQAKSLGLVDEIGYLDDAIELAKQQAGLREARVVMYQRPGQYRDNIYAGVLGRGSMWAGLSRLDLMTLMRGGTPQFMYLWMP